jgi:ABC-2 type transport system ATP-binding protein
MPEERGLYPSMLLGDQLEYLGRLHDMSGHDARTEAQRWLERFGLADRANHKVESLSHGNQQRVQLAAALLHDPELLILDEPLAGLDPSGIDTISEVLVERARRGCGVLFSSHQLDQVENLCESVVIIDHGHLVTSGTVDDLATSGTQRLVVRVEGDRDANWARELRGVTISEVTGGEARLVLDDDVDSDVVLRAAMSAGRVAEFATRRRRLSEVFREATT